MAPCLAKNRFDEMKNANLVVTILRFSKDSIEFGLWGFYNLYLVLHVRAVAGKGNDLVGFVELKYVGLTNKLFSAQRTD